MLFSDNGTSFTNEEFQTFCRKNGILHRTSAPYHPATNGLAERAVQVIKNGLRKVTQGDIHLRLVRILFVYICTPHGTTGVTPAELLMGRMLRQHLDLQLHPDLSRKVETKQEVQRKNRNGKDRTFQEKDNVFVRNYVSPEKWIEGQIVRKLGTRIYLVKLSDQKTPKPNKISHFRRQLHWLWMVNRGWFPLAR